MKILHLMAGLDETSGVANIARRFARVQAERGDVPVLIAPAFRWNPVCFGPVFAIRALWRALWADEIWAHCSWTFPVWYAAALAKLFGRRFVVVPEASFDPRRLGNHAAWKKSLVRPLDRWVLRRADEVLALCRDEIGWVRGFEPSARVRFARVPTFYAGVETEVRERGERDARARPLHVLFLGRAGDPLKGVRYLRQAVGELNRSSAVTTRGCNLIDLRIESAVRGAAKEALWDWADVLCLPTLSDNFGLVVAEALEHGRPVITTDGAPAWCDLREPQGRYLKGYRDGSDAVRVQLLGDALRDFA